MTELAPQEPPQNGHVVETESPEADVKMEDLDGEERDKVTKLEDLFDTDSDDDDIGVNTPTSTVVDATSGSTMEAIPGSASDPDIMRAFYQRLFPFRYLFQWLNHSPSPTNDFRHREFAFTLQNDVYLRYQSYPTADLFRKDVVNVLPTRFEIGPVYSTNPRDRKSLPKHGGPFKPLAKELCFDIDLTDYDDVRTCCDSANICEKCWSFITMAVKVIDVALRKDFGFKHILWVYSGRRGAHAWVCDRAARNLSDRERKAAAGYLHIMRGGTQKGKRVNVSRPLHPHITRSLEILKPYFAKEVLEDQDPWRTNEQAQKLLDLLPDKALTDALKAKWELSPDRPSTLKWADIDTVARTGASKRLDTRGLLAAKQDILLEYTYPRLDIHVSEKLNHLLKSPLVVHPGTGRVCVPINTKRLEEFDPLSVPTVQTLLREIDEWKADDSEGGGGTQDSGKPTADWEKTSLKPYIDHFRSFVGHLLRDEMGEKVKREREESDKMEF